MTFTKGRARLIIALLAFTAYVPTLTVGFLWDDHVVIEDTPSLKDLSFQTLIHDFSTDFFDGRPGDIYYRPLQTLTNRIDYTLWGKRPLGYHLTNLLLHTGNALWVLELGAAVGLPFLAAILAACLFAVHPIIVELLLIVSGRAEIMGLFFSLAAILCLLRNDRKYLLWGGGAYMAALFSKESAVMTPLWLTAVYYLRNEPASRYRRLIPLGLAWIPYFWLRHHAVGPVMAHWDFWLMIRFFFQEFPIVLLTYVRILLFPWDLHSHRLLPHLNAFWPLNLLLVLGASYGLIHRYRRWAVFCIAWFVLALLPKTPVMIFGNFMLDHWAYPASIALWLPLASVLIRYRNAKKIFVRRVAAFGTGGILAVWMLMVYMNVAARGSDEKMYRWALRFTTSNPIKFNLGLLLVQTGRAAEGARYLEEYRSHYPEDSGAVNALAMAYEATARTPLAKKLLEEYLRRFPNDVMTQRHLQFLRQQR